MKVKELINELSQFDLEMEVAIDVNEGVDAVKVSQIYLSADGVMLYGSIFNELD